MGRWGGGGPYAGKIFASMLLNLVIPFKLICKKVLKNLILDLLTPSPKGRSERGGVLWANYLLPCC